MYKFIGLIPRRDDVSREFFARYYEANHAPLALKYFRGFAKYLRNHISEELSGPPPTFDVLSEFWYESMEELTKTGVFLESELAPIIRHDENQFMNQPAMTTLSVDERLLLGPVRCVEEQAEKLVLMVKRKPELSIETFRDEMLATALSQANQVDAHRVCCSLVQHFEKESPWDAILWIWPGESDIISEAIPAPYAAFSEQCLFVRTRSVETNLVEAYQQVPAEQGATDGLSV